MSILLLLHVTIPTFLKNEKFRKIGKIGFPSEIGHTDFYTCVRVYLNEKCFVYILSIIMVFITHFLLSKI